MERPAQPKCLSDGRLDSLRLPWGIVLVILAAGLACIAGATFSSSIGVNWRVPPAVGFVLGPVLVTCAVWFMRDLLIKGKRDGALGGILVTLSADQVDAGDTLECRIKFCPLRPVDIESAELKVLGTSSSEKENHPPGGCCASAVEPQFERCVSLFPPGRVPAGQTVDATVSVTIPADALPGTDGPGFRSSFLVEVRLRAAGLATWERTHVARFMKSTRP